MVKTAAEKQRDYRERQSALLVALRAQNEALRVQLESVTGDLRAENEGLRGALAASEAECERLSGTACKHPSGAVENGFCNACRTDVW